MHRRAFCHFARRQFLGSAIVLSFSFGVGWGCVGWATIDSVRTEGAANETPAALEGIGITEHLGEKIDLGLTFRDEDGKNVALRQFFDGRPILLDLAYYDCPSLCNYHLNGLNDALKKMSWTAGHEYQLVVVSINPHEGPELAKAKRASYLKAYGRVDGASGWHFLTGDEANIQALAQQLGFHYRWDPEAKQYAHVSSAYVMSPDGTISRYLRGMDFLPQTVRLALLEASQGKISNVVDTLLLYCFHYDPKSNKYTLAAFNLVRAGGVMVILALFSFIAPYWFKQRKLEKTMQGPKQGEV